MLCSCLRAIHNTPVPSWLQWRAWPAAPVRTLPNKWRPWEKPVCRSKPHPLGGVTRCGRSQERLIWVGALVGIGFHPIIPSKGRKWCIEQRWEPNRQQSQWEAAVNPELAVVERADNAEVAFVMHHHQIEEERQEQKVGEDVHHQAVLEIQLGRESCGEWRAGWCRCTSRPLAGSRRSNLGCYAADGCRRCLLWWRGWRRWWSKTVAGQIEDQRLSALLVKWIHDGELFPAGLNQTKPSSSTVGVSPGNKKYIVSRSCLIYIHGQKYRHPW